MEEIVNALRAWNPWWAEKKVRESLKGKERLLKRELISSLQMRHIKDIIGVRRCGKTTLFYQIIDEMINQGTDPERIFFINFDDIGLKSISLEELQRTIYRINPDVECLFLDEAQEKQDWEKWIRRLYDLHKLKQIFVTGSSASLLSKDLGRVLTGRHITYVAFPFSFKEYLVFCGWVDFDEKYLFMQSEKLSHYLNKYLLYGGFPEALGKDETELKSVLTNVFGDIIARDISMRHGIDSEKIRHIAYYLITNYTKEYSYRKIAESTGVNIETAEKYVGFLKETFLISTLDVFSYKLGVQFKQNKKVYCIDNGLRNAVSFRFSEGFGQMAENLVFIELKRRGKEIYYWKNQKQKEVDFLIKEGLKVTQLIQVCWNPKEKNVKLRELSALLEAAGIFKLKEAFMITEELEDDELIGDVRIKYIPLWKWLLSTQG